MEKLSGTNIGVFTKKRTFSISIGGGKHICWTLSTSRMKMRWKTEMQPPLSRGAVTWARSAMKSRMKLSQRNRRAADNGQTVALPLPAGEHAFPGEAPGQAMSVEDRRNRRITAAVQCMTPKLPLCSYGSEGILLL